MLVGVFLDLTLEFRVVDLCRSRSYDLGPITSLETDPPPIVPALTRGRRRHHVVVLEPLNAVRF
jgi:hypothetical protein